MKKYIVLFLLVGGCLLTSAQTQKGIDVAKIIQKEASSAKRFAWRGDAYLFKGDSLYRLPFRRIRKKTEAPFHGTITPKGDAFVIKGSSLFPDVVCFAKGVVVRAKEDGIVVDHGNGLESYYGNVMSPKVQVGSKVKKGHLIGRLSQEKELLFELRLQGTPIDLAAVFHPQTGLPTYVGQLYLYKMNDSVFVSRETPMVLFAQDKEQLNKEFTTLYKQRVSEHRAKRDFVDDVIKNAADEEIKLEDVQIGPAQKQDTIRVKNTIVL